MFHGSKSIERLFYSLLISFDLMHLNLGFCLLLFAKGEFMVAIMC